MLQTDESEKKDNENRKSSLPPMANKYSEAISVALEKKKVRRCSIQNRLQAAEGINKVKNILTTDYIMPLSDRVSGVSILSKADVKLEFKESIIEEIKEEVIEN